MISDDELDMDIDTSFLSPLYSPQSPTYSPLPDFCDSLFNKDSDEVCFVKNKIIKFF